MSAKSVAEMTFQEWVDSRPKAFTFADIGRDLKAMRKFEDSLAEAVAHYLYLESKEVPDEDATLYRAAALRLINKPVDPMLMAMAGQRKSNDDPLYRNAHGTSPDLMDLWFYHHRVEIEAAERAHDAKELR